MGVFDFLSGFPSFKPAPSTQPTTSRQQQITTGAGTQQTGEKNTAQRLNEIRATLPKGSTVRYDPQTGEIEAFNPNAPEGYQFTKIKGDLTDPAVISNIRQGVTERQQTGLTAQTQETKARADIQQGKIPSYSRSQMITGLGRGGEQPERKLPVSYASRREGAPLVGPSTFQTEKGFYNQQQQIAAKQQAVANLLIPLEYKQRFGTELPAGAIITRAQYGPTPEQSSTFFQTPQGKVIRVENTALRAELPKPEAEVFGLGYTPYVMKKAEEYKPITQEELNAPDFGRRFSARLAYLGQQATFAAPALVDVIAETGKAFAEKGRFRYEPRYLGNVGGALIGGLIQSGKTLLDPRKFGTLEQGAVVAQFVAGSALGRAIRKSVV